MNTKHTLLALVLLGLIVQGCKKERPHTEPVKEEPTEQPKPAIPEKPAEEGKDPETSHTPVSNNGIVHCHVKKELSYNKFITLDLDGDKKNDLYLTSVLFYDGQSHLYLLASPISTSGGNLQLDRSVPTGINGNWARAIKKDDPIHADPAQHAQWTNYVTKGLLVDIIEKSDGKELLGPWTAQQERYLGLQLLIGGKTHYGWLRIAHKAGEEKLNIAEYAYNSRPMEQIRAGQTSN